MSHLIRLDQARTKARSAAGFGREIRAALAHLNDVAYLQTHPLVWLVGSKASANATGSGVALKQELIEAIASLRPDARTAGLSPARRRHQILEMRYVEGANASGIQAKLAISKSEYYREHQEALQAVAALLQERWRLAESLGMAPSRKDFPPGRLGAAGWELAIGGGLPVPLTSFVGRERELDQLAHLVVNGQRLLTVVGPPGVGKTRLAIEAAAGLTEEFRDGVCFVSLAEIPTADLIPSAIAAGISMQHYGPEHVSEAVARALASREMLLVLDNFEHLVSAAPQIAQLLQACPRLSVLTTSRVPLRVRGEREFPLDPLPLPDVSADSDELAQNPAVKLFVDRATATQPSLEPAPDTLTTIARICTRLDGLPLAIELAAARAKLLPVEAILERLNPRLALLADGARDLPSRQRSLWAATSWSYSLLHSTEQLLFRRLGVFVGGWTIDAAQQVAAYGSDVLPGLAALVDSSLVRRTEQRGREARFGTLETIREYARECLASSGEAEEIARRHAAYYLEFAESADPLITAQQTAMDREHDNLRAALREWVERDDGDKSLRLATALSIFCHERGYYQEGRDHLRAAFALPAASERTITRARALLGLAGLARHQGEDSDALTAAQEALDIALSLGDPRSRGWALEELGRLANRAGDRARAHGLIEQSLAIAVHLGDRLATAHCLGILGGLLHAGGNDAEARPLLDQACGLYRDAGVASRYAMTLRHLASLARDLGDVAQARRLGRESVSLAQDLGPFWVAAALESMAAVAATEGQAARAVRLAGAAAGVRGAVGAHMPMQWEPELSRNLEPARRALDETARETAWTEGLAMTREQAIAYALDGRT